MDQIKMDLPILRVRFPKPQPPDAADRSLPVPFRYPTSATTATHNPWAFQADRIDDLFQRCGDKSARNDKPAPGLDIITVWGKDAELATKRQFTAPAGQRSPGADAYAAKLRKMNIKVYWGRETVASSADLAQVRGRMHALVQKVPDEPNLDKTTGIPGYMLRKPCKNCPFAPTQHRITFRNRDRAQDIANQAYLSGFPCHESATYREDEEGEADGFVFGPKTQHCAGALMMLLADGHGKWPGIGSDRKLATDLLNRLDWDAPYYATEELFLRANTGRHDDD